MLSVMLFAAHLANATVSQRIIISDFEDVGTWRAAAQTGVKSGAWFAGDIWMGTSFGPAFADEHSGELRFAFAEKTNQPRRIHFRRAKMGLVSGFLDGIEFDANAQGHSVSLRFGLLDSARKRHWTPAVRLEKSGWQHYRIALDTATWPGISNVSLPASVELVILESDRGGEGSVLMDDLAITGSFPRRNHLSIFPLYTGINYEPENPVGASYRIRNFDAKEARVSVSAQIRTAEKAAGREGVSSSAPFEKTLTQTLDLPAHGQALASFDFGALPVGAWSIRVNVQSESDARVVTSYDDTIGVFVPNGKRINKSPMWFGVQDTMPWNNPAENVLHINWMRALGIDMDRIVFSGHRFMSEAPKSIDAWRPILDRYEEANIDSVILFGDTPPSLIQKNNNRLPPNDLVAFERYSAELGHFLRDYPSVRYIEFWNEPDLDFFHGTLAEYWDMFGAFSRGFRSTAPKIKITTGGGTISHPREKPGFNQALYTQHGELYDIAAFHAHGTLSNYTQRHRQVESWLGSAGLSKQIVNTESGERSGYDLRGEFEQAVTLVKKLAWAKAQPNSEFHIWFTLQDYWDMDPEADDSFGLVTSDNRAKPSFVAYNELIRQLANTTPAPRADVTAVEKKHGVTLLEFVREDGNRVTLCWAAAGNPGGVLWIRTGEKSTQKIGMFGETQMLVSGTDHIITVDSKPFYLVSPGTDPLRILSEEERELNAPLEIYRDASSPSPIQFTVRNARNENSIRIIALRDSNGTELVSEKITLPPHSLQTVTLVIPPVAITDQNGERSHQYVAELSDAISGKSMATLPLFVQERYSIVREGTGRPATLILNSQQDITGLAFDPTTPVWRGPNDLSVEARLTHDSRNVIFRFAVTDDKHVQLGNPEGELWRSDSVQIAFYAPASKVQTLLDLGLASDNRSIVWCYRSTENPKRENRTWTESEAPRAFRREGTVTYYEIRVPFDMLGLPAAELFPGEGIPVRFSFLVNENDGQGRVRWMRWRGGLGDNQDIAPLGHGILK